MKKNVKVSIVTICYNCREDLLKTIKSVAEQTYQSIEYIVVDGGSSDGSVDIIKLNEDKITNWISESDAGIYDAMNKGITLASGEWIIFMNAGDVFYDAHVLSRIFSKEYNDNVGIIFGDVELDFGNNRKVRKSFCKFDTNIVAKELCHQSVLTRTEILKKIKYDLQYKIFADINSFIKIYEFGWNFVYVPVIIATFEITGGISSNKPFLSLRENKRLYNDKILSRSFLKRLIRAINRYLMLKLLPKDLYSTIRFHKLLRKKQYQN